MAGLYRDELDSIYGLGQICLQTGQIPQAVALWRALVSLDPYQARSWRALGVAHHHAGEVPAASAAYAAALYLDPNHALTQVYAAEAHLLLGESAMAAHWAKAVRRGQNTEALLRLGQLYPAADAHTTSTRSAVEAVSPAQGAAAKTAAPNVDTGAAKTDFCLADGRPLPLADSTFAPAGDADETTLIFDLAQAQTLARPQGHAPLVSHTSHAAPPAAATMLPPPLYALPEVALPSPKERTLTQQQRPLDTPAGLEATAARRLGLFLTDEITLGPQNAGAAGATDMTDETTHAFGPQNKG